MKCLLHLSAFWKQNWIVPPYGHRFASSSSWRWKIQYCVIDSVDYRERSLQTQVEGFEIVNKEGGGWKASGEVCWPYILVWGTSVLLASNGFLHRYFPWSSPTAVSIPPKHCSSSFSGCYHFSTEELIWYLLLLQWWDELGGKQALGAGQWSRSEWLIHLFVNIKHEGRHQLWNTSAIVMDKVWKNIRKNEIIAGFFF